MTEASARVVASRFSFGDLERRVGPLRVKDWLGIVFVALFAFCYLSPALKDGPTFGPADLGSGLSVLTSPVGGQIVHDNVNGDIIDQGVPWNTLSYQLVHKGEFPLWNNLSGNGLPQFLNFESGVLALPSLVGYLVPLSISFLVTVAMKLLIAGMGTYLCARLLGIGALGATFGAVTFMLSGSFSGWLGWSISSVYCWSGFLFATALLAYRSRHRVREVVALGVVVAFFFYGGFPEGEVILAGAFVALGVGVLIAKFVVHEQLSFRGASRVALGLCAGAGLSAPLLLGGIPLLRESVRGSSNTASGLSLHTILGLFAQGYSGLPIKGSTYFGTADYFETAAYVGVIALVFCCVALIVSFRSPIIIGISCAIVACALVTFRLGSFDPVQSLVRHVGLGSIAVQRGVGVLGFFLALLSAFGAQLLYSRLREARVQIALFAGAVAVGLVVVLMWLELPSAGNSSACLAQLSAASCRSLRRSSLLWPSALVIFVLAGAFVPVLVQRLRWSAERMCGGFVLVCLAGQSLFLLFAGVGINSYAGLAYPMTPPVTKLASLAGGALVGIDGGNSVCLPGEPAACGVRQWEGIGLYPEMNIVYGIAELATHDPIAPLKYFAGWPVNGAGQTNAAVNLFAPDVNSVALARRYGVSIVLVNPHVALPTGMDEIARLTTGAGAVAVMAVPDSARFSFADAHDRVLSATTGSASYRVTVTSPSSATLIAHVTDVPGWHATAGGRALPVSRAPGDLLEIAVPSGTTSIRLSYMPASLLEGLLVALVVLLVLAGWPLFRRLLGKRHAGSDVVPGSG